MTVQSSPSPFANSAIAMPTIWQRIEKPVTCLLLTVALSLLASSLAKAKAQRVESPEIVPVSSSVVVEVASHPAVSPLPSGVYRYGQTANRGEGNLTQMVFEVSNNRIVGAFYVPQSSFDCFEGEFRDQQMALMVRDSYDHTGHSFVIPLREGAIASSIPTVAPVQLVGFEPVTAVTPNDHRLLATCRSTVR